MGAHLTTESIKEKLIVKTVRNVRKFGEKEAGESQGMYRPEIKLDLQRSRYLTESYKATEGQPMVLRRAKALENILTKLDIFVQDQ